jgi:tetratricopeptide (TPR) repeat protein
VGAILSRSPERRARYIFQRAFRQKPPDLKRAVATIEDRVIARIRESSARDDRAARVEIIRAEAYRQSDNLKRAMEVATSALQWPILNRKTRAALHSVVGMTCTNGCDWARAIGEFEDAVRLDPGCAMYLIGLGWARYGDAILLERPDVLERAHEHWRKALYYPLDPFHWLFVHHMLKSTQHQMQTILADPIRELIVPWQVVQVQELDHELMQTKDPGTILGKTAEIAHCLKRIEADVNVTESIVVKQFCRSAETLLAMILLMRHRTNVFVRCGHIVAAAELDQTVVALLDQIRHVHANPLRGLPMQRFAASLINAMEWRSRVVPPPTDLRRLETVLSCPLLVPSEHQWCVYYHYANALMRAGEDIGAVLGALSQASDLVELLPATSRQRATKRIDKLRRDAKIAGIRLN